MPNDAASNPSPGTPKNLPPLPRVSSTDIVKAAAAAGIINPKLAQGHRGASGGSQVETAEKRAKRLARNRESARKSRRMKKELLQTLGAKVNDLHDELDAERRKCIDKMEHGMSRSRGEAIDSLDLHMEGNNDPDVLKESVGFIVKDGGPNCPSRKAIANYQYDTLHAQLLPSYRQFLLWFSAQNPSFLTVGKDERAKVSCVHDNLTFRILCSAHFSYSAL